MSAPERTDVFIAGGGIAGLVAAAAFAEAGWHVICADPKPIATDAADPAADLRTTAFLQPSQALLARAGLWPRLVAHATPLQVMRIVNLGARETARDFDAGDIGELPFGWNLPNWLMRREVAAHLESLPSAFYRPGVAAISVVSRDDHAIVQMSDGGQISARLVLAADGRDSTLRQQSGISVRRFRYGQKALAFAVTHDMPHQNRSTEIHRAGGPFTLVPLPDHKGKPASAIVWMDRGAEIQRRMALDVEAFEAELNERSGDEYGRLKLATHLTQWPIISQIAGRFHAGRMALMAEAAHVVPPIGAQGLNMSLADIACLLDLAERRPEALGDAAMLRSYDRRRRPEVTARVLGVDVLNRASMAGAAPWQRLRANATAALHDIAPVRRALMTLGMAHGGRRADVETVNPVETAGS